MMGRHAAVNGRAPEGMTLVELLVATALAALLILGLVAIVSAASEASLLQRNQAEIHDNARYVLDLMARSVRQAGFNPHPWDDAYSIEALSTDTADGGPGASDRLGVRAWSDRNCFDNRNPDLDPEGEPLFYIRESVFDLTGDRHLAHRCRYGPSPAELTTQIARQGLVRGIESFQVLYGEDEDGDGNIERWVAAREWSDPVHVLGLRIGLLAASKDKPAERAASEYQVLDVTESRPPDGRLRRVFGIAAAIRGRTR
jgi:type IV pilus assembly protein PilW